MSSCAYLERVRELRSRYPHHLATGDQGPSFDHRIGTFFDRHARLILLPFGLLLVALTGLVDYSTGPDLSFAIFYLIPIAAGAWWGNFSYGILLSLASTLVWHLVEEIENPALPMIASLWNGTVRFGFFVITSSLLTRLRISMLYQRTLARTDPLTGVANGRTFYEIAQLELERSARTGRAFTLAYIDLDNFKGVNDRLGHSVGDAVLRCVSNVVQRSTRAVDLLARIGGDEFALLLPETDEAGAAGSMEKLRELLLKEMAVRGWPITFSIGVATFRKPPADVDIMLRHVDALMYTVKHNGRNAVRLETVDGEPLRQDKSMFAERRSTVRLLCNCPTRIRAEGNHDPDTSFAIIKNISTIGIGVLLESAISDGTLLTIEPMCNPRAKTLLAKVIRATPDPKGWFHGCELAQPLKGEELQNWLG